MAGTLGKQTGIGSSVSVQDMGGTARIISTDVLSFDIDDSAAAIDATGVDSSTDTTLVGRSKGALTLNCAFDPNANMAHAVFSQGIGIPRQVIILFKDSTSATTATYTTTALHLGYKVSRAANGALTVPISMVAAPGFAGVWS